MPHQVVAIFSIRKRVDKIESRIHAYRYLPDTLRQ